MRRSASCVRSSWSLRSTPLAALLGAVLAVSGCGGGGGGGGGSGGAGGTAKGGTSGGGSTGKGGAAGSTTTGTGGTGGTGTGGTAGAGKGGAAGSTTTGTGGTGTGGTTAGTGGTGTGGTTAGTGGTGTGGTTAGTGGTGVGGSGGSGTICTDGGSCTTSGGITGVCASGTCGGCTSSTACTMAYGTGYVCLTASGNCVMGNCATNGDCNGKICGSNHTCGACATKADCTTAYGTGYICQTSSGTCIQGTCNTNTDCGTGQICSGNTCTSCGTSDSACSTAYGAGYICVSGGCVMGNCHSGAQCQNGKICNSSHVCASCTDDSGCQASYTDGRICDTTTGACIIGNCHTNENCSNGQVCISNACVNCTASGQCSSGQVCLPSGACVTGNCLTAAADCSTTEVCINNRCGACTASSDCTAAYGGNHVCDSNGHCASGNCVTNADCAATGQICGSVMPLTCGTCGSGAAGDSACQSAYGSGYICSSGACITGNCHDSTGCAAGQVCNLSTHTCGGCGSGATGDTACQNDGKYGTGYICQANACIVGNCHTATDCNNPAQVCNNFTCGSCSVTADCTNAYGANHVCNGSGQCVSGNCTSSSQCGGNQLCISNACTACTAGATGDAQCLNDTTYGPMHICLGGQCVAGNCHDTSGECTGGQICGINAAHVCGSCGTGAAGDNACKADTTYGTADICLSGGCVQGDCHDTDTDCAAGKICGVSTQHTCGNCSAGSAGDTQCQTDSHYGSNDICYQGLCAPGNCHATSADCSGANAGLICGVSATNTCGSCTSDSQCKNDSFYGANDICNTATGKCVSATCAPSNAACMANGTDYCCGGTCVTGNCCTDTDCGASGTACVNHTCSTCNGVSGNKWYVDPVNGNDSTATGSDTSGSSVAPGCAFKTIKKLLNVMPSTPFAGTQIIIVGTSGSTTGLAAGETYPITIPANTTLTTTGGPVTITVPAATLFQLNNNASGITGGAGAPLVLDGANHTGGTAILNSPGTSTFTSSISNLTIQSTNNDGIRVTAGTLTVGAGVVVTTSNQDGLHVTGGAANINNPSGAQTLFSNNAQHGIEVGALGSVSITGTPGSPIPSNSGTVLVYQNTQAGIRINQTPGAMGLVTSNINGLVSWANTNYGFRLFAGSQVKVRNSIFLGNGQYGILVSGANVANGDDVSKIDLGKAGDPGKNWLQTPLGALGTNASGGLCVALANCTSIACLNGMAGVTANVSAEGNEMVSSSGNMQVDCSTATTAITKGTCGGMRSDGINAATNVTTTVDVAGCM